MRTAYFKIALCSAVLLWGNLGYCLDVSKEERACIEIGFKKKTPAYGECVLQLAEGRLALEEKNKTNHKASTSQIRYKSSPARMGSNDIWDLRRVALSSAPITYLNRPDGTIYETVNNEDVKSIVSVANTIGKTAGIAPSLYIRESNQINAGATFDKQGKPIIIINKPMLDLIKDDPDMAAALIGHEMAHLYLRHPGSNIGTDIAGSILGAVAGIALEVIAQNKLGVTNLGLQGGNLIGAAFSTSFTRDQEREADKLGLAWAKQNGYDPNGGIRLFQILEKTNGNAAIPFFQSHPNPSERIINAGQSGVEKRVLE